MLRTQSSVCRDVAPFFHARNRQHFLWEDEFPYRSGLLYLHRRSFTARFFRLNIFCTVRARRNNVAAFSKAQDTKVDTSRHNVSLTLCARLAKDLYSGLAVKVNCKKYNYIHSAL